MSNDETALVPAELLGGQLSTDVLDLMQGDSWLPRLQLFIAKTDACAKGLIPINHYGLVRGQSDPVDLGESVDILVLPSRPKALDVSDRDNVIMIFDPKAEPDEVSGKNKPTGEFKRIMETSFQKDSGCMFGPEFLVWIPSTKEFATFFMGSKSARREAGSVTVLVGKAATLKAVEASNNNYTWFKPVATACSTPFDMPTEDDIKKQVTDFLNPPERSTGEVVEEAARER